MTYYTASQFTERWYMTFKDMQDGLWRISIEDPTFSGTATQLTPAANPFEWMGNGDEDQTKCVLGSTGTMRIMVTNESDIADLRPTELNNRRVTAKRNDVILWQGYIKQEEYSQDWVAAPYELEIPIRSALDLATDMPLKPYVDMPDFSTMVSFLDYIIPNMLGMSSTKWMTNYIGSEWNAATVCKEHYYTLDNDITGKNVGDVLDSFFAPFGRISEYCGVVCIRLDKPLSWILYTHNIGESTMSTKMLSGLSLSDIDIVSTENTKSMIAAPANVEFDYDVTGNSHILRLKSSDIVYDTTTKSTRRYPVNDFNTTPCYYFNDDLHGVNGPYSLENVYPTNTSVNYAQIIKGDRKDEQKSNDRQEFSYVEPVCVMLNTGTKGSAEFYITPHMKARTSGTGYIILKVKIYDSEGNTGSGRNKIKVAIANIENTPVLFYKSPALGFVPTYTTFRLDDSDVFTIDDGSCILPFQTSGKLKLIFSTDGNIGTDKTYYIVPELYYMDKVAWATTAPRPFFFDDVSRKTTIKNGGSGDDISVTFDSLSKASFKDIKDKCHSAPSKCFCEDINSVILGTRTKLELSEVRTADPTTLHTYPAIVTDGDTRYIPVATGMNARNCTTQLRLVSTNI